jgi:tRNA A-37 threonylcarbamoyl transferase component Bud32
LATGKGVLKRGRRTRVTRVVVRGQAMAVKEYLRGGLFDVVKVLLRGTRVGLAWRAAEQLAACGIRTPEPVAAVARGHSRYLVTRFVEGAVALDRLLAGRFAGPLSREEIAAKRRMLRQLGRWLRHIHDQGIYHNDWSCKNILTVEHNGAWAFYLLDLESVTFYKGLTGRRRRKNLSQLNDAPVGATLTDRLRLLVAYAGDDAHLTRGRFPTLIAQATRRRTERASRTRRRQARQRAAGHPIED